MLSEDMKKFAEKARSLLQKVICGEAVTLALDGGTVHRKLQSLSVIVKGKAFYLKAFQVCTFFFLFLSGIIILNFLFRLFTMMVAQY